LSVLSMTHDTTLTIDQVSNFGVKHVGLRLSSLRVTAYTSAQIQELVASKPRIMPQINQIEVY